MNLLAPITRAVAALRVRLADPHGRSYRFNNPAGIHVNHENAEQVAAVWACMDVIAAALSSSDWNVLAGSKGGDNKKALPDDSLQYILNTRFNPEMTAQAGKRAVALGAVGYGNGYAEIERDLSGRIINLWPINPARVSPRRDMETGKLFYRVMQEWGGGWADMDSDDLFVIRGASLVGFAGDDAISRAIQTISTAIALDQFSSGFFGNGAQLGTVFTYKGKLDDPHYERVKQQIENRHQGAKNAFKSGFFEGAGEWDVKTLGMDAEKSQLVNVKYVSIEEICRWFRVPPHKIAHLLRATNNNIEHQGLEFSRDTLRPWVKEIEQEADYKLIAYRGPPKCVEIDVDWAEQGDYGSRATAYSTLRACGVLSVNDVLRKLGENTIGTVGDVRTMNGAAVRLEDVGKNMLPAPSPAAPATEPDETDDEPDSTATAWLTSVYARIQRRFDNGARNMQAAGHSDWQSRAREATKAYAKEHVDELADVLGSKTDAAQKWAVEVINGCEPAVAAVAAMGNRIEIEA